MFFLCFSFFCFLFLLHLQITIKQLTICIKPFRMKTLMQRCLLTVFFLLMKQLRAQTPGLMFPAMNMPMVVRFTWKLATDPRSYDQASIAAHYLLLSVCRVGSGGCPCSAKWGNWPTVAPGPPIRWTGWVATRWQDRTATASFFPALDIRHRPSVCRRDMMATIGAARSTVRNRHRPTTSISVAMQQNGAPTVPWDFQ